MSIRRWIITKRQEGKRQAKTRKHSYLKRNQNFQHQNCGSTKRQSEHFATLPSRLRVCVFSSASSPVLRMRARVPTLRPAMPARRQPPSTPAAKLPSLPGQERQTCKRRLRYPRSDTCKKMGRGPQIATAFPPTTCNPLTYPRKICRSPRP